MMSSAFAMSLFEKSEPIQLWPIMDDGILMTRFTLGEYVHMLSSSVRVPLPRSRAGSVTRTSDCSSPRVHARIVIERSQSGRWMTIWISEYDETPRQWSTASRMIPDASRSWAEPIVLNESTNISNTRMVMPHWTIDFSQYFTWLRRR